MCVSKPSSVRTKILVDVLLELSPFVYLCLAFLFPPTNTNCPFELVCYFLSQKKSASQTKQKLKTVGFFLSANFFCAIELVSICGYEIHNGTNVVSKKMNFKKIAVYHNHTIALFAFFFGLFFPRV